MEVALAATVLALTLVGMIQVIDSGSEMLDLSRKQTIAAQILQDEIDQLRLMSWSQITSLPTPATVISTDATFSTFAQQMGGSFPFTGTRTVNHGSSGASVLHGDMDRRYRSPVYPHQHDLCR